MLDLVLQVLRDIGLGLAVFGLLGAVLVAPVLIVGLALEVYYRLKPEKRPPSFIEAYATYIRLQLYLAALECVEEARRGNTMCTRHIRVF